MADYEPVIGLEVHAQLRTRTKAFCRCSARFGAEPNTHTCPVCLGHPGALPVLNAAAVRLAVKAALALESEIRPHSVFARKHYFYPDLPKGYQISQYDEPVAVGGALEIETGGETRRIGLIRLHLEEDAGKSVHDGMPDSDACTYVDLNRSGVPLAEIVSQPEIHSPEEAYLFLRRLRSVLRYAGICDGNMEEGSLRCDANVSIRPAGAGSLGTRTELKNLNSFRNVRRALEYEIGRQAEILESGGEIGQETVLWDASAGVTRPMRGKEEAHDYRYLPEPDLPPLVLDPEWIEEVRASLPVMPQARKRSLIDDHGLGEYEADLLSQERELVDYFEEVAGISGNAKATSNFIINDLLRTQNEEGRGEDDIPLPAKRLAALIRMVDDGTVSLSAARREVFEEMYRTGRDPGEIVRDRGLEQVSDDDTIRRLVREVLDAHPEEAAIYRSGKKTLFAFFVGQVMKRSGGKANPGKLNEILEEVLAE